MYFDRRAHPQLISAFETGEPLHFILEAIRAHPDLDLQFRHDPKTPSRSKATVYCGGTRVLEVLYGTPGWFRLDANAECRLEAAYLPDWDQRRLCEDYRSERAKIERYLEDARKSVNVGRWLTEGQIEAGLASSQSSFAVLDRQSRIGFSTKSERDEVLGGLGAQFAKCLYRPKVSTEADVLALDEAGRVLVIEVKHTSAGDLANAPTQACFDAALFRRWASGVGDNAAEILNGMLQQRTRLGLSPDLGVWLNPEFDIVPVAAVGGAELSDSALLSMTTTRNELLQDGSVAPQEMEVWALDASGHRMRVIT